MTVRSFNGAKYVSVSEKSCIELKDDIGDVVGVEAIFDGSGDVKVVNAKIVGVLSCESYVGFIVKFYLYV